MFIITAKCSKRRVVKILLIFALLLSLFLALRACRHSSPPPVIAAGTNEERIAYLASLGWEVNDQPIETLSVTLGETLEEPYLSYNDLQRSQGFDLTRYCGQTLSRYTYVVTNYPDASLPCQADLYVCDGALAAGEVITSPMPGNILKINVAQGQHVNEGDVLIVLEAMKMENEISATKSGTVAQISVTKGAVVETGTPLVVIA